MRNIRKGDLVYFGEGADRAIGKIVEVGYPISAIDFGVKFGLESTVVACFTGGIRIIPENELQEAETKFLNTLAHNNPIFQDPQHTGEPPASPNDP